jgi:hypothetical protein
LEAAVEALTQYHAEHLRLGAGEAQATERKGLG